MGDERRVQHARMRIGATARHRVLVCAVRHKRKAPMSRRMAILSILILAAMAGFAQFRPRKSRTKPAKCEDTAQTQWELNDCASKDNREAEKELKVLYEQLLARASQKPTYRQKIEAEQTAWIAYRDAALEAKYPAQDKQAGYGSVYPMCYGWYRAALIRRRSEEIKELLEAPEGDVCSGEWAVPPEKSTCHAPRNRLTVSKQERFASACACLGKLLPNVLGFRARVAFHVRSPF